MSFLYNQTPDMIKCRYTKNGLSSASVNASALNTTAPLWGNNISTPQQGRNPNMSLDSGNYHNILSASMNQGSINKNIMSSQSQRYFADSHQRERNDIPNKFGIDATQYSALNNSSILNSNSMNSYNPKIGAYADQQRAYNTVLKNLNNNNLNSASTSENTGRILDNSLSGQSIAKQVSASYLQSKSVSHPANNIIHRGMHNATQINGNKFDDRNNILLLERSQQEIARNQRSISSIREQGFLQSQQNDVLLKDGQTFIRSRKILLDILISIIVIVVAYVLYRLSCFVFNIRFQLFTEIKYVGALCISMICKICTFKHKLVIDSNLFLYLILGFSVDCLATQYCLGQAISVFLSQKLNLDLRFQYKEYYLISLTLVCTMFLYMKNRFIENNQVQSVNRQIRTIIKQTFTDIIYNFFDYIKYSLLPILIGLIGMFLGGERFNKLFINSADAYNTSYTKCFFLIYALTLTQVIIFKVCTDIIINLKSQFIWNFLSEIHDIHQIQHFYFIFADKKLNDDFLELRALKFWQANFNNRQRVNILKRISIEGQQIQIWNVFLRHCVFLKDRINRFRMDKVHLFENVYKLNQKCPEPLLQKISFKIKNRKALIDNLQLKHELIYLLQMVIYSIDNLTNTILTYRNIKEYDELFNSTYSYSTLADIMESVFQDVIVLQGHIKQDSRLQHIYRQLLCNMSQLIDITHDSQDLKLFNATIKSVLSKPESFYNN